jgi:hypothetical protein
MLPQRSRNVTMTRRSIAAALILTFIGGIDLARADPVAKIPAGPLQQSIARIHAKPLQVHTAQSPRPRPPAHGSAKRTIFAAIGALGDFVAGFILGAPVGMIVGGGIGYKLGRWERLAAMTRLRSVSPCRFGVAMNASNPELVRARPVI